MTKPLKSHACSLPLAARLKELGVPQNGLWKWVRAIKRKDGGIGEPFIRVGSPFPGTDECSGFTVSELGDMLPVEDPVFEGPVVWQIQKEENGEWSFFTTSIDNINGKETPLAFSGGSEADARAKMLIYLLENHLITPP